MARHVQGILTWRYLAAWHAASAGLLLLVANWRLGTPFWHLPLGDLIPFACLAAAFLVATLVSAMLPHPAKAREFVTLVLFIGTIFGLIFFGFVLAKTHFPRTISIVALSAAMILTPLPHLLGASPVRQRFALALLVSLALLAPYALGFAERFPHRSSMLVRSEYYNLAIETYARVVPKSVVYGGAIARFGSRYLLVTGDGQLLLFDWDAGSGDIRTTALPFRVPLNGIELAQFASRPWATPYPGTGEDEAATDAPEIVNTEWMRTHGLLVQETGSITRIFVSYNYWKSDEQCFVERVSVLEAEQAKFVDGVEDLVWRTLFETTPCLPVTGPQRRRGIPFVGYFGGGRMALLDQATILLTVGDFGFDGVASVQVHPQDPTSSYGKTIAIDIASGRNTLFTMGHRNPQGLTIGRDGTIWSTEHGPRGGDELNRLVRGKNYGWPYVTDGTDYGSFTWPLKKGGEEQGEFVAPLFAWVPSIAISNLVVSDGRQFPNWKDDLLIATLNAKTLYRARLRAGQVAYLEAIFVGASIRDLLEGHDGRIILWTDEQVLMSIQTQASTSGEAIFVEKCSGCHQATLVSGNRIGPNLHGIVGRRIASLRNYPDYSAALQKIDGKWTVERLDQFLGEPDQFAPGTKMDAVKIEDRGQRTAVVEYLRSLR